MNAKKRAAVFCRANLMTNGVAGILQKQLDSCLDHPILKGLERPRIFIDIASGRAPIEKRSGLTALMNAIENDLLDVVICQDLDRISRNSRTSLHVLNAMQNHQVSLATSDGYYSADTDTSGRTLALLISLHEVTSCFFEVDEEDVVSALSARRGLT